MKLVTGKSEVIIEYAVKPLQIYFDTSSEKDTSLMIMYNSPPAPTVAVQGAAVPGSTPNAGTGPPGPPGVPSAGPTPVFPHEFLDAAATTAVCFCHRFLNPFGASSMALTTTPSG